MHGTQTLPFKFKIVSISFIVQGSPSSHGTSDVGPVLQFTKVPEHGIQILPSQSKIVSLSLIVLGLPSSQP